MALLLLSSTDDADMRYAARVIIPDPFVYLDTGRARYFVVHRLEHERVRHARKDAQVLLNTDVAPGAKRLADVALALLRRRRITRVRMSESTPAGRYRHLLQAGITVELVPHPFPERWCKRADELAAIAKARLGAEAAMRAAIDLIRGSRISKGRLEHDGPVTSQRVRRLIAQTLLEHECTDTSSIVACGAHSAQPHHRGEGVLHAHRPIVIDIFPRHASGYHFDMTRTVVRGRASDVVRRMHAAVSEAQRAAIAQLRPGVAARRIHATAQRVLARHGFTTHGDEGFIHSSGHGLGLAVHEPPRLGPGDARLREGMVVAVEPGLYYRRHGGVRIEDVVHIGAHGARTLSHVPNVLEL